MIDSQKPGFDDLYKAMFGFFLDAIAKDKTVWNKVRLQMMTQYFDDLAFYKVINPIVIRINSNPEERRAIARAALWDAMFAHHNSEMFRGFTPSPPDVQAIDGPEDEPVEALATPVIAAPRVVRRGRPPAAKGY